jgi:acetate kinase
VSRIGEAGPYLDYSGPKGAYRKDIESPTHADALDSVLRALRDPDDGVLDSLDDIQAVGHRVVHGGSVIRQSVLIDDAVVDQVKDLIPLAPLHNPPNLVGIIDCRNLLPDTPQVAVVDTSFHQTMPAHAYMYAIPYNMYEQYGLRRYGFHGSSYRYVSRRAATMLGQQPQDLRMVICHLGNGSSVAAVMHGRSIDTSMGMTPLEGLVMGTRSGDIDAGLVLSLCSNRVGLAPEEVDRMLNKESGLLGISGVSNDVRELSAHAAAGDLRCMLALDMYAYRIKKYIGAYAAAMGGIDALVFPAGIGENSTEVRASICNGLGFLGIAVDPESNSAARGEEADITAEAAGVRVLVVPTDEEMIIFEDTLMLTQAVNASA